MTCQCFILSGILLWTPCNGANGKTRHIFTKRGLFQLRWSKSVGDCSKQNKSCLKKKKNKMTKQDERCFFDDIKTEFPPGNGLEVQSEQVFLIQGCVFRMILKVLGETWLIVVWTGWGGDFLLSSFLWEMRHVIAFSLYYGFWICYLDLVK